MICIKTFCSKKNIKINTSLFSQLRHFAQMPVRWVSVAGRYLLRWLLCQMGNGANKATWRLRRSCYTITVGRKGEVRLFPGAWLSRRGWERLCSEVCSQGQDAGVAKRWGSPPTDSRPGAASPFQACCGSVPAVFLGHHCCCSRFHPCRWLKPSKCHTAAVSPVTPPFQVMAAFGMQQAVGKRGNRTKNGPFVPKSPLCEVPQI